MLPRNHPDRIRIAFDDHRLVANAGLVLPATLALRLPQLLQKHLDLGNAPGRANTGKKLIFALPRRTTGVAWAEKNGGLLLQLIPGSDTVLQLAMARVILENGWEDSEFIERWVANAWEIDAGMGRGSRNTPWQWRTTWGKLGADFQEYKEWLFQQPHAELDRAAEITGVPADLIVRAAEMLANPVDGQRPKASFGLEKGNYWSNNYGNTASFAALALICGSGNRPGRVVSRMGGHQRGWIGAAPYPIDKSPNRLPGRRRQEIDLDRWVESGAEQTGVSAGEVGTAPSQAADAGTGPQSPAPKPPAAKAPTARTQPARPPGQRTPPAPVASAPAEGFCIRCRASIPANPTQPYCSRCYGNWKRYGNKEYSEKHCHICGKDHTATLLKPACLACFRKVKDSLEFAAS